jgi:hypothetical protein
MISRMVISAVNGEATTCLAAIWESLLELGHRNSSENTQTNKRLSAVVSQKVANLDGHFATSILSRVNI